MSLLATQATSPGPHKRFMSIFPGDAQDLFVGTGAFSLIAVLSFSLTLICPESVVLRPDEFAIGLFRQRLHLIAVHAVEPVLTGRRSLDEAAVGHVVLLPCPQAILARLPNDQVRDCNSFYALITTGSVGYSRRYQKSDKAWVRNLDLAISGIKNICRVSHDYAVITLFGQQPQPYH